jgi:hypothetical protein
VKFADGDDDEQNILSLRCANRTVADQLCNQEGITTRQGHSELVLLGGIQD